MKICSVPNVTLGQKVCFRSVLALFFMAGTSQFVAAAGIEEIIVTAQKRVQSVQEVPISISVFQGDSLEERGVTDVAALSAVAPSVTLDAGTPFSGSTAVLGAFIRGIGSNDFAMNIDPGVGVYLDGVYLARSVGANLDLPDIERIEILKGPQGTLFGRNTIGGAISIVTRTPGDEFEGEGSITIGDDNRLDLKGFMSLPLNDKLGASLAYSSKKRDGFAERQQYRSNTPYIVDDIRSYRIAGYEQPSQEGGQDEWTLRGKLVWEASDSVNVTFSTDYLHQDQQGQNSTLLHAYTATDFAPGALPNGVLADLYNGCVMGAPLPPSLCGGRGTQVNPELLQAGFAGVNVDADPSNNRLLWGEHFVTGDMDTSYSTAANFSQLDSFGASATVSWDLNDSMTLKSITSYRDLDWAASQDLDGSPLTIADLSFSTTQNQFSQEFQLTGSAFNDAVDYVAGAYYFKEEGELIDYPILGQGFLQIYSYNEIETENYAAFGQVDWKINDLVSVTAGARYTEEDKSILLAMQELNGFIYKLPLGAADSSTPPEQLLAIAQSLPQVFGDVGDNPLLYGFVDPQNQKFENFSGRLGVQIFPADDLMFYLNWSEGYKTGGWTNRYTVPATDPESPRFDEETATTVELGVKTQLFSNAMQINAAVFDTDYDNIQLNQQVGVSPVIDNQGNANIRGGEVEIQALLSDAFSLNMNLSYLDATFKTILPSAYLAPDAYRAGVFAGAPLPKTPEWKFNISPRYEWSLKSGASLVLLADYTWTDELWNDTERTYLIKRGSTDIINMSLSYESPEQDWKVTVGGSNITDERYLINGYSAPATGVLSGTYSRGSLWFARFGYEF